MVACFTVRSTNFGSVRSLLAMLERPNHIERILLDPLASVALLRFECLRELIVTEIFLGTLFVTERWLDEG